MSTTEQNDPISSLREKHTDIENVLPPVSILLETAKYHTFQYVDLDSNEVTIDFAEPAQADPLPIPMPVDREGYGTVDNSHRYWATGLGDWRNVATAIRQFLPEPFVEETRPKRLFDFGCATGRFLRHVWLDQEYRLEPWGCDFSPENIAWNKRHLPSDFRILLNHSFPQLPFPDGFFDVVTAFSVFTHIDLFEEAWLLELARITRSDGLLYLTIQNEATWAKVANRPDYIRHIGKAAEFTQDVEFSDDMFNRPMSSERIVFQMSPQRNYNCNVWHSNNYITDNWSRFANVLKIANNGRLVVSVARDSAAIAYRMQRRQSAIHSQPPR
ncbi:MAG: class I SAM-dependent methyltransferase [Pirellulaceae bacterium]